jgi:ribosome-binding protein aMBF1 (putative translation factor)
MPRTHVAFFQEADGKAPVVNWLRELMETNEKAWAHCRARVELLAQFGHELRRPAAAYLRDGIYELRAKQGHVQYRILYFFHGRQVAILAHSLTKEETIPAVEIDAPLSEKSYLSPTPGNTRMKPKAETKKTSDAVAILGRMAGDRPELRRLTEQARVNAAVAQLIYDARNKAGLSQAELAERIGTKQSVISRLEDADYEGHSLSMLQRIAAALGRCVQIRFLAPAKAARARRSSTAIPEPAA